MNTFMKGDHVYPPRDWSMLSDALATLESIIHPQNKPIFDLLLEGEVSHNDLLQQTGLNPRQFKRRINNLLKHRLICEFNGIPQVSYALEKESFEQICQNSLSLVQSTP